MKRRNFISHWLWILLIFIFLLSESEVIAQQTQEKPNVLFIAVDDLNDWVIGENQRIQAPNLDRLASRGVSFSRAYSPSPACNPSRTAILTGKEPYTTGVYGNGSDWQQALPDVVTLPQHFKENGYKTHAAGKIFHHVGRGAFHDHDAFDEYFPFYEEYLPYKKLNGLNGFVNNAGVFEWVSNTFDWGVVPYTEDALLDVKSINWASDFLLQSYEKPFFLAVGLFRPHLPYFAPGEYFEEYPLEEIELAPYRKNDLDDVPSGGMKLWSQWQNLYQTIAQGEKKKPGTFGKAIQAYKAAATFADHQIGLLLDALENSDYAENTIIVLWSDHGYHLGEKEHWTKFVLWERATHVPFMIVAPEITPKGKVVDQPVSLIDIYPTLIELCGLKSNIELDGTSLLPLLKNPDAEWEKPAVMTYLPGNYAVRTERWRFIQYADGTQELYDMIKDPNEWNNLAIKSDDKPKKIIEDLKNWLPEHEADMVKNYQSWREKNQ